MRYRFERVIRQTVVVDSRDQTSVVSAVVTTLWVLGQGPTEIPGFVSIRQTESVSQPELAGAHGHHAVTTSAVVWDRLWRAVCSCEWSAEAGDANAAAAAGRAHLEEARLAGR